MKVINKKEFNGEKYHGTKTSCFLSIDYIKHMFGVWDNATCQYLKKVAEQYFPTSYKGVGASPSFNSKVFLVAFEKKLRELGGVDEGPKPVSAEEFGSYSKDSMSDDVKKLLELKPADYSGFFEYKYGSETMPFSSDDEEY